MYNVLFLFAVSTLVSDKDTCPINILIRTYSVCRFRALSVRKRGQCVNWWVYRLLPRNFEADGLPLPFLTSAKNITAVAADKEYHVTA